MGMVLSLPLAEEAHDRAFNEALAYSSTETIFIQPLGPSYSNESVQEGVPVWQQWIISIGCLSFIMITGGSGYVYFRVSGRDIPVSVDSLRSSCVWTVNLCNRISTWLRTQRDPVPVDEEGTEMVTMDGAANQEVRAPKAQEGKGGPEIVVRTGLQNKPSVDAQGFESVDLESCSTPASFKAKSSSCTDPLGAGYNQDSVALNKQVLNKPSLQPRSGPDRDAPATKTDSSVQIRTILRSFFSTVPVQTVHHERVDPVCDIPRIPAAKIQSVSDCNKAVEPVNVEPVNVEPVNVDPVNVDPVNVDPVNVGLDPPDLGLGALLLPPHSPLLLSSGEGSAHYAGLPQKPQQPLLNVNRGHVESVPVRPESESHDHDNDFPLGNLPVDLHPPAVSQSDQDKNLVAPVSIQEPEKVPGSIVDLIDLVQDDEEDVFFNTRENLNSGDVDELLTDVSSPDLVCSTPLKQFSPEVVDEMSATGDDPVDENSDPGTGRSAPAISEANLLRPPRPKRSQKVIDYRPCF